MAPSWQQFLLVAIGGAIGAMARFLVAHTASHVWGDRFPIATLGVNVFGCLALGLIVRLGPTVVPEGLRLTLGMGLLGALTTFSTFGVETWQKASEGQWGVAGASVAANLILGLLAVGIGMGLGGLIVGSPVTKP